MAWHGRRSISETTPPHCITLSFLFCLQFQKMKLWHIQFIMKPSHALFALSVRVVLWDHTSLLKTELERRSHVLLKISIILGFLNHFRIIIYPSSIKDWDRSERAYHLKATLKLSSLLRVFLIQGYSFISPNIDQNKRIIHWLKYQVILPSLH